MNPRGTFPIGKARTLVYARSSGACEKCGLRRAVHWHHRLNRSQGGTWHPSNGLHLCLEDHLLMDGSDDELFDNGWRIKAWDKRPYTEIPVLHWQWGWVTLDDLGDLHLTERPEVVPDDAA
ncbi:HNH endonuclease [Amycolatopsis sp. NPDC004772]